MAKKLNCKGFGAVGLIVILVIIGLVLSIGVLVYNKQEKAESNNRTPVAQNIKVADSTNTFSFSYPNNWQLKPYVWEDCCGGPPESEPDWSQETKPITLYPQDNHNVAVTIIMEKYGNELSSYEALKASIKQDYFAKVLFEGKRDDGHEALFSRVDYLGPPDAKVESFTDHRYYFNNEISFLRVEFREKYHHDWPDDNIRPDVDNSKYLPAFEAIANSINFSK